MLHLKMHLGNTTQRLNEYLAKLNVTDSEKCVQCKTSAETVKHFLLQCPSSELCGKVVAACNSMSVNTGIETILSHATVLDIMILICCTNAFKLGYSTNQTLRKSMARVGRSQRSERSNSTTNTGQRKRRNRGGNLLILMSHCTSNNLRNVSLLNQLTATNVICKHHNN